MAASLDLRTRFLSYNSFSYFFIDLVTYSSLVGRLRDEMPLGLSWVLGDIVIILLL